jgi:hypothetical protein
MGLRKQRKVNSFYCNRSLNNKRILPHNWRAQYPYKYQALIIMQFWQVFYLKFSLIKKKKQGIDNNRKKRL